MSEVTQSFVGVDLHKCTVTLAAVNSEGEKIALLTISTKSVGKIEEWLAGQRLQADVELFDIWAERVPSTPTYMAGGVRALLEQQGLGQP